jgi:DNA-binding IclR family transcriptional regulator
MPKKAVHLSIADANPAPGGVAAVDRALSLLAAFKPGDTQLSLMELADRSRLYKSTVLRLLISLEHGGFIQKRSDGRYALGYEIARLNGIYATSFSLSDVVMPVLQDLAAQTRESAAFHVVQGEHRLCLHRVDSPQPIRYHISEGDILPLDRGAGGRMLSAALGARGKLYDKIRADGYVMIMGDRIPELSGVSAAVTNARGELVGAVTLTMPTSRVKQEFADSIRAAADKLTHALGGQPRFGTARQRS